MNKTPESQSDSRDLKNWVSIIPVVFGIINFILNPIISFSSKWVILGLSFLAAIGLACWRFHREIGRLISNLVKHLTKKGGEQEEKLFVKIRDSTSWILIIFIFTGFLVYLLVTFIIFEGPPRPCRFRGDEFSIAISRFDNRWWSAYYLESEGRLQPPLKESIEMNLKSDRGIDTICLFDKRFRNNESSSEFIMDIGATLLLWRGDRKRNASLDKARVKITISNDQIRDLNEGIEKELNRVIQESYPEGYIIYSAPLYFKQTVPRMAVKIIGTQRPEYLVYLCQDNYKDDLSWITRWISTLRTLYKGLKSDRDQFLTNAERDAIACMDEANQIFVSASDKGLIKKFKTLMLVTFNNCFISRNLNQLGTRQLRTRYLSLTDRFQLGNLENIQRRPPIF